MSRLQKGSKVPDLSLNTIQGSVVMIPYKSSPLLHIQFRRYAGCPICNLHLRTVAKRHDEITAAGIKELVFFHSKADDMIPHLGDMPFECVADPKKAYYQRFGVETSLLGSLNPKNLVPALKGLRSLSPRIFCKKPENGNLGMPADFLIDSEGRIIDLKYGSFADDQWSVDELLMKAEGA